MLLRIYVAVLLHIVFKKKKGEVGGLDSARVPKE